MLAISALSGAIVGSFLNVCIYRIPTGLSILKPASACPKCNQKIRFSDNIPIISYLILRGRCRSCNEPISWRYPLVELITAGTTAAVYMVYGVTLQGGACLVLIYLLTVITFIDVDHMIIPDKLVFLGLLTGFAALFSGANPIGWRDALLGVFVYGGLLYLPGLAGKRIFKKDAMGIGDVKLGAMMGLFLGWKMIIMSLYAAFFVASAVGLTALVTGRLRTGDRVPFGPFLAAGTLVTLFFGERLLKLYIRIIT